MTPFTTLTAIAAPLIRDNIDTDAIIPSREMKSVGKTGLADGLFAGWRYTAMGSRDPDPGFVLNDPHYAKARILLAGANVGCGSSREHAAWALAEYGFRAIVAVSFNPIFRGNCVRNGIVPVEIDANGIEADGPITIDLPRQILTTTSGREMPFAIDAEAKAMLIGGLDAIDLTLTRADEIARFREQDRARRPWVYF
ncbi:MAG: 3-isopropylmalate dehydratase small subunit [Sphingomonas sp.]|uniref:3-isopropylmalate dehydratase small subunit n=1 Tax=Sphingomonas sp. TaxID=28214 RepID=UPI0025E3B625|nr:3-isopropylmalate dehydratase small subunit [Sphingomonas sp.]MBX3564186.1 3-isopropylmalate dehydratase small subunit [Sphingomonas sp.]